MRISTDGRGRWMDNVFIQRLCRSLKYEAALFAGAYGRVRGPGAGRGIDRIPQRFGPHSSLSGRTPWQIPHEGV